MSRHAKKAYTLNSSLARSNQNAIVCAVHVIAMRMAIYSEHFLDCDLASSCRLYCDQSCKYSPSWIPRYTFYTAFSYDTIP